jgi:hypothetical protein
VFYIQRENFPDRLLNPPALQALAEMWVAWYRLWRARRVISSIGAVSEYRLAVELYGLPRHQIPEVSRDLLARLGPGLPGCAAEAPDADTLCVVGPRRPINEPPEISLWLSLLSTAEAQGTVARLRAEVFAGAGVLGTGGARYDLVLVGTPRGRGMNLRRCGRRGAGPRRTGCGGTRGGRTRRHSCGRSTFSCRSRTTG